MVTKREPLYESEMMAHAERMCMVLEKFRHQDHYDLEDYLAMERALQVLVESLIGMGRYVLKINCKLVLAKSGEVIDALFRHGLVSEQEHAECRQMVGYRNVLVHDYLNINPAITVAIVREARFDRVRGIVSALIVTLKP
jgi:uncharacterized protein YutE (UPF0331/DUF86 family)